MKLVKGTNLTPQQLQEVKACFVHRHLAIGKDKYYYSEQDWIINHAFYVRKDGHIANKSNHCEPAFMAS